MATSAEQAFIASVRTAQGVRQAAYASAFATYAPNGFGVFANLAAYLAAIVAADNAWAVSVQSAATTAGISPRTVDAFMGPIYGNIANIIS